MKPSHAIAHLRQLCCLGLEKEFLLPEFLAALPKAIPSGFNMYSDLNEQLIAVRAVTPYDLPDLDSIYEGINRRFWTPDKHQRAAALLRSHPVLTDGAQVDDHFNRSEMYNVLFRPFGIHFIVNAPVAIHGKIIGMLSVSRPLSSRPFRAEEELLCVHLAGYLAHALDAPKQPVEFGSVGRPGLVILDDTGDILFIDSNAKRMLILACYPAMFKWDDFRENGLPAELLGLCRQLRTIFQNKTAAPPSWCHSNGRGRFVFRAHWLDPAQTEPKDWIGLVIDHEEPLVLLLMRALLHTPLSPIQKEVALMLAQDLTNAQIGQRLHVKAETVKDHVRKIFDKLDVHKREELRPKLLSMGRSPPFYH